MGPGMEDPAMLAGALGGALGGASAGPDPLAAGVPAGPGPMPMDPGMGMPMGPPAPGMGPGPMPPDPGMGMGGAPQPAAAGFPSADPQLIAQVLGQVLMLQEADRAQLAAQQQDAIVTNPAFAMLVGAAPAPGAGMDGGAVGGDMPLMPPPSEAEIGLA